MKNQLIKTGIIATIALSFTKLGLLNSIVLFLILGIVPGTHYSIPSSIMLLGTVTAIWLLVIVVATYGRIFRKASAVAEGVSKSLSKRRSIDA